MELQYDLFYDVDEHEVLKLQVQDIKLRQDNLRRGIFSRHGDLCKMVIAMNSTIEAMQVEIDKLKVNS